MIGLTPYTLSYAAIIERGGSSHGHFKLFKCPKCGHPVIHDFEHDYFYPDPNDLNNSIPLGSCGDTVPCPECGFQFVSDDVWEFSREPTSHRDWLITLPDIQARGLGWLLPSDVTPR